MSFRRVRAAALLLAGAPLGAEAHLVSTGVGPFYDGAAHFFVSAEELLPVLAVALLAGLRGPRYGRWVIAVLPVAWLVGASLGLRDPGIALPQLVGVALLIVPGVLVALDRQLPLWTVVALAVLLGLLAGLANGAAMAAGGGWRAALGATTMAFVVSTFGAAVVVALRAPWTRVAARVAGSWIAALGLLSLGWLLRLQA
jgi:hydrogenase/urease accessory protein HupE